MRELPVLLDRLEQAGGPASPGRHGAPTRAPQLAESVVHAIRAAAATAPPRVRGAHWQEPRSCQRAPPEGG
jgi:hypothetical protein